MTQKSEPLLGYPHQLSVAPGDELLFSTNGDSWRPGRLVARIVKIICADTRSAGPGASEEALDWAVEHQETSAYSQPSLFSLQCRPGSWGESGKLPVMQCWTLSCYFMPTLSSDSQQTLLDFFPGDLTVSILRDQLGVWRRPDVESLRYARGLPRRYWEQEAHEMGSKLGTALPVAKHRWHWLCLSAEADHLEVFLKRYPGNVGEPPMEWSYSLPLTKPLRSPETLLFAARRTDFLEGFRMDRFHDRHFNGRIESPWIARGKLAAAEAYIISRDATALAEDVRIVGAWDFSREAHSDSIIDRNPARPAGSLNNHPTRAVRGVQWDGSAHDWTRRPEHYGAIHFHEDDLTDADWPVTLRLAIPPAATSGIYAVRIKSGSQEDCIPFFIRPTAAQARARIAFLVPTASYLAYANNRFPMYAALVGSTPLRAKDQVLHDYPNFGWSLYERHSDGSGVHYSSRLRPILDLKPCEDAWGFSADTHITAWLHRMELPFDVITDEDLDREGAALLAPYSVVLTGTHPEYASTRMLDGIEGYLAQGGRLMYMGGNGLYWRIAYDPHNPAVIELRRTEGRGRAWDSPPGEYYHSFTGEYGGLWRNLGRTPNQILGVGFVALAGDAGTFYRKQSGAEDARAEFIFRGTREGADFGRYGSLGAGAVSQEIDRWNPLRGSPAHALVLASSVEHSPEFELVTEERYGEFASDDRPRLRGDMTFFETPAGGAVFSTGSIGFAAALAHNAYDNDISRITANVLQRFLDPTPFEYPKA